jgi:hypothetical protein
LTVTNCVDSSKILQPVLDRRERHGRGKKVMQFLSGRRYIAVDGKVQFYGKAALDELNGKCREEH